MNNLIKSILLSIPLIFISSLSFAEGCGGLVENTQVVTEIDAACEKQILGFEPTIDIINKAFMAQNSPSELDVVTGKYKSDGSMSSSSLLSLHALGILAVTLIAVLGVTFAFGFVKNIYHAQKAGNETNVLANGATSANAIKMLVKTPFVVGWTALVVVCVVLSFKGVALLIYNIQIQNNKTIQLSYSSYASDSKNKADKRAASDIGPLLKYASCVIDHDKRLIFDNSVASDYTLKDSDYLTCMKSNSSVLDEPKTSFISRHLYKVQDCGIKYAKLSNATCGFVNFKIDAQQILKQKYIEFEDKLLTAANDIRNYYCLNQSIVDKDAQIKNQCWAYNPVTNEIPLDGKGRISYVTAGKSFADLKATKAGLQNELSVALQATALENFKTYTPVKREINVTSYIKSVFTENELIRAVKNYNNLAMDYDFEYVDEFQYNQVGSNYSTINNFIDGGTSTTSSSNKRIESIIDSLTQKTQDEFLKETVMSMANFMGSDYVENLGLEYKAGGDYNVISSTIIAGQQTATYLIVTSLALKGVEGGLSMIGTRSQSGKPDMTVIVLEKTMGFFGSYMLAMGLAVAGAVIGLVLLIISTLCSQVIAVGQNVVKIAYIYELTFVMAGIDDKSGKAFNHDDISRRLITLLYVLLALSAIVIEFELSRYVAYLLTDFAKDNFYLINQSAGYVVESGNTVMSVVYDFIVLFAFHVIVISTMMLGMTKVNQSFNAALILKLFGSQDLKSGALLEDTKKIAQATESHFGSMAKSARSQRI
ncbi:hypothetical protein [Pseudomonas sp. HY7a-MNA-CIBAN-0227]|uniref:hypothetical protein n=1 Tax=Pseudomonas sp. HY7a-MNA-CIBAN-0227 TaxID=3140474 RepID=UPI003323486B